MTKFNACVVPSPRGDFVELARTQSGRLFRKQILSKGPLLHPTTGQTIDVDDKFLATLTKNFNDGVCDIVQVPKADGANAHTEDPDRNIGEVIGVETEGDKFYAMIDARNADDADKLGKTLLGASAMMHLDYKNTKTGLKVGPTLLHVCVTNRPYVTGLEDYRELVAASADGGGEELVMLTAAPSTLTQTEEKKMDLQEMMATLQLEHGIDVPALQAQAKVGVELTAALADSGILKLTNGETVKAEDLVASVVELSATNTTLSSRVETLEKSAVETEIDGLVKQGRILPAQRDSYIELRLTNPAMFDKLVPAEPLIKLSVEAGTDPTDQQKQDADVDAEVTRLSAVAKDAGYLVKA